MMSRAIEESAISTISLYTYLSFPESSFKVESYPQISLNSLTLHTDACFVLIDHMAITQRLIGNCRRDGGLVSIMYKGENERENRLSGAPLSPRAQADLVRDEHLAVIEKIKWLYRRGELLPDKIENLILADLPSPL